MIYKMVIKKDGGKELITPIQIKPNDDHKE